MGAELAGEAATLWGKMGDAGTPAGRAAEDTLPPGRAPPAPSHHGGQELGGEGTSLTAATPTTSAQGRLRASLRNTSTHDCARVSACSEGNVGERRWRIPESEVTWTNVTVHSTLAAGILGLILRVGRTIRITYGYNVSFQSHPGSSHSQAPTTSPGSCRWSHTQPGWRRDSKPGAGRKSAEELE